MHGGFPVNSLPEKSNLDRLRKQAKDLLRLCNDGDAAAFERLPKRLPAAHGKSSAEIIVLKLRRHDAQSCSEHEYGFPSWSELKE